MILMYMVNSSARHWVADLRIVSLSLSVRICQVNSTLLNGNQLHAEDIWRHYLIYTNSHSTFYMSDTEMSTTARCKTIFKIFLDTRILHWCS